MDLKSRIRTVPDFPKKGIMFRDITPLIKDSVAFDFIVEKICERHKDSKIDYVAGIESRGFILGGAVACRLGKGFVPIRKAGKLPFKTERETYELEYSTASVEIHVDALERGSRILLVDDLVATAGTLLAAIRLIEKLGGAVIECAVIIELPDLGGRDRIMQSGHELFSLVKF